MVNSEELVVPQYLTLSKRCLVNRCHYNRVRLYFKLTAHLLVNVYTITTPTWFG
jgi:hypothetical protein